MPPKRESPNSEFFKGLNGIFMKVPQAGGFVAIKDYLTFVVYQISLDPNHYPPHPGDPSL